MTDHSATIHTIGGAPASGETTADVLASIRRLIAQSDTGSRRDAPPLRRAQPEIAVDEPAPSDLDATPDRPLQLHRDSLIPPAAPPAQLHTRRLRLATAEDGPVAADSRSDAQPALPPHEAEAAVAAPRPFALSPSRMMRLPAPVPDAADATNDDPTAATQMAQADGRAHNRPADDTGDSTALHLFAPADEDIPNGSILRSLLREAIRQELQGEMGGRFSRNLRRVIRQEVACAIDEALSRRA